MFKIGDVAPDIAAMVAELEAHKAACEAAECERCGRRSVALSAAQFKAILDKGQRDEWAKLSLASLPTDFDAAALDAPWLAKLVGAQAIATAHQNLATPRLVFVGPSGSGKTSLAIAMFRAALDAEPARDYRRSGHLYVSAYKLAKARACHPLGEGEAPLVAQALRAPVLLLDEVGGEDPRHASAVAEVIYERHAEGMPTWVTTGTDPEKLAARYGGGIGRRMFEGATVFRLVGRTR